MKNYFLDTNILHDFLTNRQPFGILALEIFKQKVSAKWNLHVSDNSITTTYFILKRHLGNKLAKQKVKELLQLIDVIPVSKTELSFAIDSKFNDFEDAVQYATAMKHGDIDAIITRNKKDFRQSQISVLSPDELFM